MDNKHKYSGQFHAFIESIFSSDGVEGIANSLPFVVGAFVVTVDGIMVAANDAFLELVDYDRGELYGNSYKMVTHPEDHKTVEDHFQSAGFNAYDIRLVTSNSEVRHVIVSPYTIVINGVRYRLAQFLDNTHIVNLQKNKITALRKTATAISNMIETRDPYTYGHMHRTAAIAVEIAKRLTLNDESIESIHLGAEVHDIGKITIPIEVLIKPSRLEQHEWEYIKYHPEAGHKILRDIEFVDTIKNIVLMHHECQDGSGYPDGRIGEDIPVEVAIVTAADCLEAIAGIRPYHKANSFEVALEIMQRQSQKFHKNILEAVEDIVKSGTLVGTEFGLSD